MTYVGENEEYPASPTLPVPTTEQDLPVPVQQIVNLRELWAQRATERTMPYDDLVNAAAADVQLLARHALGQVQDAYNAGAITGSAYASAHDYELRGLDILYQAHKLYTEAWEHGTQEEKQEQLRNLMAAVGKALEYRAKGIKALAWGNEAAGALLAPAAQAARTAQLLEQGPVGVEPPLVSDPATRAELLRRQVQGLPGEPTLLDDLPV